MRLYLRAVLLTQLQDLIKYQLQEEEQQGPLMISRIFVNYQSIFSLSKASSVHKQAFSYVCDRKTRKLILGHSDFILLRRVPFYGEVPARVLYLFQLSHREFDEQPAHQRLFDLV